MLMKKFFKIIKMIVLVIVGLFVAFIILGLILTSKTKNDSDLQKAQVTSSTPEMLIAPLNNTATNEPTATIEQTDTPVPTQTPLPIIPSVTPISVRNAGIPVYSNEGVILGFLDNSSLEPTATLDFSMLLTQKNTNIDENHPFGCNIKGNVSMRNNQEHIYHCPNWRDYDRTEVNYDEGDRWFCTEQDAVAAGFRRPYNVGNKACITN